MHVNGIGERAGNAALEEIVMATRVRADRLPYRTSLDARQIYALSQLLSRLNGQAVQANQAVVGRNAFAHEAGIHQDGVLKDRRTYEVMRPEDVGAPAGSLVLGKHSGRRAVQKRCAELGFPLTGAQLDHVYQVLMAIADTQKVITDTDVVCAATSVRGVVQLVSERQINPYPHKTRCTRQVTVTACDAVRTAGGERQRRRRRAGR